MLTPKCNSRRCLRARLDLATAPPSTVDHAARLPAQRGPWRAHGSLAQHSSQLHAARQHGLGPLVVGAFRPLPCFTRCEFADGSFNSVGPIVAAATLSVGPTAPDAVRGRQVVLRLHGHTYGTNPVVTTEITDPHNSPPRRHQWARSLSLPRPSDKIVDWSRGCPRASHELRCGGLLWACSACVGIMLMLRLWRKVAL